MRAGTVAVGVVAVALAGAACSAFETREPSPYRPPGVTSEVPVLGAGRTLYERDRAWCHGSAGQGTTFGPDLNGPLDGGAYTHFMVATGRMPLEAPNERAVPAPSRYEAAQIDAIVAHVETFGGTG